MRHFDLSPMIESSLETYQYVVAEISKEIVKTKPLSAEGFDTIEDLISGELNQKFYVDLTILQEAENLLGEFLECAKDLDDEQIIGAINDTLTMFCELGEKDNYMIRILKRLEHSMGHNGLLDIRRSPKQIDYGMHPLDAKELREGDLGVFQELDIKLFKALIRAVELGKNIHDLEMLFNASYLISFDCDTRELANIQLEKELKEAMSL
jgi:hypothetical protein|tara:strand:+ start:1680 stop:2306 length:627 start_codon:yes stop_codon:yes gene_type:complete